MSEELVTALVDNFSEDVEKNPHQWKVVSDGDDVFLLNYREGLSIDIRNGDHMEINGEFLVSNKELQEKIFSVVQKKKDQEEKKMAFLKEWKGVTWKGLK